MNNEQVDAFFLQVQTLIDQANYTNAIVELEQYAPIFEAAGVWEAYVKCLLKHSECLWRNGKYQESIAIGNTVLSFCLNKWGEHHELTANCYNNLGICYFNMHNNDQALFYLQKSLTIRQNLSGNVAAGTGYSYLGLGNYYLTNGEYDKALHHYHQATHILKQVLPQQHVTLGMIINNIGNIYFEIGNYDLAIDHYQEVLLIYEAVYGELNPNTAEIYNNLGNTYSVKGNTQKAAFYLNKSMEVKAKTLPERHPDMMFGYLGLGMLYQDQSDYTYALMFYRKALKFAIDVCFANFNFIVNIHQNIGTCYFNLGNPTRAIDYFNQAIDIQSTHFGDNSIKIAQLYYNLGINYHSLELQDKALEFLNQALTILLSLPYKQYYDIGLCYSAIGKYYLFLGNYTEAKHQFQEAATTFFEVFGNESPYLSTLYGNLANVYVRQQLYEQSLLFLQKSLKALALNVDENNFYQLPTLQKYNQSVVLLHTIADKAQVFKLLYSQTFRLSNLAAAIAHYECADELIDQIRLSYKAEGSKLTLAGLAKTKVYDAGLEALFYAELLVSNNPQASFPENESGYSLPDSPINLAFCFAERSKATLFHASLTDAKARFDAQLPSDLLEQEYNLRTELTYLEQRIAEEAYQVPEDRDDAALMEWHERYFDQKQSYLALIQKMEAEYPDYYRLKYDFTTATIAQIQAALPPQSAMLCYLLSQHHLYTFVITPNGSHWVQYALPHDFKGLIDDFRYSLKDLFNNGFLVYAHDMYRHLFLPIAHLLEHIDRLVIIPDDILIHVPFEALLTDPCKENTPQQDLPYLVQQYTISYHFSATLWLHQKNRQTSDTKEQLADFIGFAPIYSPTIPNQTEQAFGQNWEVDVLENPDVELSSQNHRITYANQEEVLRAKEAGKDSVELPYSKEEVSRIQTLFHQHNQSAHIMLHQAANLNTFTKLAGNYRYLLIAAHADYIDIQPEKTGIIFAPNDTDGKGILYVSDSYNLQLQADLVVLSCCETGLGKIEKGEGVMALNRGFLFAGAKNVIYTLLKIYDQTSQELTIELFKAVLSGLPHAEALCQAKRHLIAKGYKPYVWAGYVLVGT